MNNIRHFLTFVALTAAATQVRAQLVINELMQSNIDCVMDDLNEFPDSWAELYNTGAEPVNLGEYKIGLKEKADDAWQLPSQTIGPGQYVIVFCDKEENGLHTDFRIDSGKGSLFLFRGDETADKVESIKKQPAPNIAYGRKNDGADKWGYQLTPTPGAANCGSTTSDILGEPVFSETGRVVTGAHNIALTLSLPEGTPEGAAIRYTTDGSEPTAASPRYENPLTINKTTVVRAKIFCDGWLSPRSTTHSFIFHQWDVTLPVVSISTDSRYFYDSKIGIYVDGNYQRGKKNYEFDWRRPISFEYFEGTDTPSILNQLCETRIMGGATRGNKFKSLAVYANKRFGTKRLEYEFFPDQKPGLTDFKSICLRNAGNDFDYLYMRDAIIQRNMASHTDLDWQAWRPIIIYINGEYKGMLNIRERSNEDNIYTNYDGLEDLDMFENWHELKEGTWDNYDAFKAFYSEEGHTLAEYSQWLDWEEFINLMSMCLYYNNVDFPGNNIVMWRPRTEGGRWRWIAKDVDYTMGLYGDPYTYKIIEWLYNPDYDWNKHWGANSSEATMLFRHLMDDADFNREFIDRTCIYMGDFMNEKGTWEVWEPMYETIKYEYPHHRALINPWWPNYSEEMKNARNWLSKRTNEFYKQIGNFYKLGTPITMQVNTTLPEEQQRALPFLFNGIKLSKGTFDGRFFVGRNITLQGIATDESIVTGWDITQVSANGVVNSSHVDGNILSLTMPDTYRLVIKAVIGENTGITTVNDTKAHAWQWTADAAQLRLTGVTAGTDVRLYDLQGRLLRHVKAQSSTLSLPLPASSPMFILKVRSETVKIRR